MTDVKWTGQQLVLSEDEKKLWSQIYDATAVGFATQHPGCMPDYVLEKAVELADAAVMVRRSRLGEVCPPQS